MYAKSKLYQTLFLILTLKSLKVKRNILLPLTMKQMGYWSQSEQ